MGLPLPGHSILIYYPLLPKARTGEVGAERERHVQRLKVGLYMKQRND
jgi:hypothetical protein